MEEFRKVAPLHVLQSPYNLFKREIEAEIRHYCSNNGIATLGALCRGLLSGSMHADTAFHGDELRRGRSEIPATTFCTISCGARRTIEVG